MTVLVGADARGADTERVREQVGVGAPARRGRGARGRPAALPVPDRGGVATAPRTLRELAATSARRRRRDRPEAARAARADVPADRVGARPAAALPAPLPRPHAQGRDRGARRRARRRRSSPRCKRVSSRPTRQRKTMVEAVVEDETALLNLAFFNQPWRERQLAVGTEVALFGKLDIYRGKRQLDEPDRRRARPGRRREDGRHRADLPAVGEGRRVDVGAPEGGRRDAGLRRRPRRPARPTTCVRS